MESLQYKYWRDDDMWLGYLNEYPDYWTQGETVEELEDNLADIRAEIASGLPRLSSSTPR